MTECRNGSYTLSLETTVNDDCANLLLSQRIICAKANPFDDEQYFEIQSTERGTNGIIKVECKHIKSYCFQYCSEGDMAYDGDLLSIKGTPKEVWDKLQKDYITTTVPFNFSSDITSSNDFTLGISTPETLGNILGGKEGSFLDVWGGEYHFDNFNIHLLKSRGKVQDYILRYGSNISAPIFEIENHSCTTDKVYMLDCTSFLDSYSVGKQGYKYDAVKNAMTKYAKSYGKKNNLGSLKVSIDVTLKSELEQMSNLGLCDTVTVILDSIGTKATAKITEVTYDSLNERWEKLVVGESKVTVADLILNKRR